MKKLVRVAFLFLMVAACKKEEPNEEYLVPKKSAPPPAYDFRFIKAGNISTFDVVANMFGIKDSTLNAATLEIIDDPGSGKYRIVLHTGSPLLQSDDTLLWTKDTVALQEEISGKLFPILFSNPVSGGKYTGYISGPDTIHRKVESVSENVTVRYGTYSCVKIKEYLSSANPATTYKLWFFHKEKGLVLKEEYQGGVRVLSYKLSQTNF